MDSRPSREAIAAALRKTYPEHLRKSSDGQMLGDADAFLAALLPTEDHAPGDFHDYRPLICRVCGQPGQVVVSIEPQREPTND